ncbi:helix-turn-helix transcriptional regulator [Nocardia sp. NPDC050406]|uniref:helix-turn-helix transcriptional regulator n=1 Tax=Nocardia sp. NPDC050406 TaxID=3364318 RepID=UPI0037B555D9
MTATVQRFSLLLSGIHDAGVDPARWDTVIADVTAVLGAVRGFLVLAEPVGPRVAACGASDADIREHLAQTADPVRRLPVGEIETWRSDTLLARLGDSVPASWICHQMPKHTELPEDSESHTLLRALLPHFEQALRTRARLAELTRDRTLALATVEKARYGVMIVTTELRLTFANARATAITLAADGLAVDSFGRLRTTSPTQQPRLRWLIGAAAGPAEVGGSIAIARSGKRPLTVHIAPLDGSAHCRAVLLTVDPDDDQGPSPAALQELYGLTETESLVARGVLRGDGLPAVAAQLRVSVSTARTHLQHIFVKTGTHRQAELVRVLLTVALAAQ